MPSVGFIAIVRHAALAKVLLDLDDDVERRAGASGAGGRRGVRDDAQRVVDVGQVAVLELNVDDRADHLNDAAGVLCLISHYQLLATPRQ